MIIQTFGFAGNLGSPSFVRVELRIERGILFRISGVQGPAARAAQARIRSALLACGNRWPGKAITVNLAPAELARTSTAFDLPIALAILSAQGSIPPSALTNIASAGELGLDGTLRPWQTSLFNSVSNLSSLVATQKISSLIIPNSLNSSDYHIPIEKFNHLRDVIAHLNSSKFSTPEFLRNNTLANALAKPHIVPTEYSSSNITFDDIEGEETAKRKAIIAAAGKHHLLLIGPPGTGKSMIARCVHALLPDLTEFHSDANRQIHAAAGLDVSPENRRPPWQAPHSSTGANGLSGSWSINRTGGAIPGAWSLAHQGVLFLDEWAEFSRPALESCRIPLESKCIALVRAAGSTELPADALLIAALNPCPCGRLTHVLGGCACTPGEVRRYFRKISGPIADRIAIHIELGNEPKTTGDGIVNNGWSWEEAKERVAWVINWRETNLKSANEKIKLTPDASQWLSQFQKSAHISHRGMKHIRDVALTAALVDKSPFIESGHIAEAAESRLFDRPEWLESIFDRSIPNYRKELSPKLASCINNIP